ncbi:MAG: hypothetical protein KC421_29275 [Anaerolineales bacterium]|nr:hypothetical protein [Anaerolineales bacterium]
MRIEEIEEEVSEKTAKEKAFEYRLQTLTFEIQYIERSIARLDEITQTTKYWAILIWTGSISLLIGRQNLNEYVLFTSVIPLLFWLIDARWRFWLGYFSYRQGKISEFINSEDFEKSFEMKSFAEFNILDPLGKAYRNNTEFQKKRTLRRALKSTEVMPLYFGMFIISLAVGIFFNINSLP